ncbi:ATP-binding protein [Caulobacter vibrioides]|uniref:histidine kinase n=2 Tax=Caulobacter vibrioides TaxID=155892 RepID=Q9A9P2_CAUVC|nr:ATP-binding protein [Caulobacter vibrioides]YP_002516356.1 hybrid sensor histidine kinase/receiver protein [Caulobacter vibrioides NA1000]AAK22918.1 sensor histidine kinase/response regulator [Caulobacter vibrioides CB15]ACL94448.1 hybrid sensor histidine kinase/receiver protein [Caulobacter vibrioides NA1000]ATC27768.1 hybrid sensor histidine kinase/response regulator [Caulobacter vibrioides]QXZ53010.1 response regulator [Caulobacter vibrioides]
MAPSKGEDSRLVRIALTEAYVPIARGYLLAAAIYNSLIAIAHPFYEKGLAFVMLTSLTGATAIYAFSAWFLLRRRRIVGGHLEWLVLGMNALFLGHVTAFHLFHLEPQKLIYFVLLALVFATSAPSRRVANVSVGAALVSLVFIARGAPGDMVNQYLFVGLAGAFAAVGMSTLMRGVVGREVRARLASQALNDELERELTENRRLRTEAQALALAAEKANRAKSEFLATMSHEIRTPLNGVLGMAQIMASGKLQVDQRRRLETITASGQSLLGLINTILDVSRIEDGKMEIVEGPFDLTAQMHTLSLLYGGLARDKHLDFSLEVSPTVAGCRQGDGERLRQVLSNLISNAIKFTDSGAVRVTLDGDDQGLVARVLDTGVGIPEAQRERLFTKFAQLDSSSTRRVGGSGLGLAICKSLAELMGGEIRFLAPAEGGACFELTLPMARIDPPPAVAAPPAPALAPASADEDAAPRILVVDDNQTNRAVLLTLLGHLGADAHFAVDGRDAVAMWEQDRWDVILMDIHMPEMDGLQACQVIREGERQGGRLRTPVVAVTASVLPHERSLYVEAGMDAVVPKPVEVPKLLEVLANVLADADEAAVETRGAA